MRRSENGGLECSGMVGLLCLFAVAAALTTEPMVLEVDRGAEELRITFALAEDLPEELELNLASGTTARVDYELRVYGRRRFIIPDRRIWKGLAKASAIFDAVTGRYLCQLIVNGETTASREVDSVSAARRWLRSPPAVTVPLPEARRESIVRVRVRAVFASGTTWLVFPSTEGTDWLEIRLEPEAVDPDE